jgi:lycopene cyclase CruP
MPLTHTHLAHLPETLKALQQTDDRWKSLRQGSRSIPHVITTDQKSLDTIDYDVLIAGGTLGITIAAALAMRGFRVGVIERGILRGRDQEWNISRHELQTLIDLNLLTAAELETAISSEFNPIRIKFGDTEIWTENVLNIGVDPVYLLETLKQKFLTAGGTLLEKMGFESAIVHPNGVQVLLQSGTSQSGTSQSGTSQSGTSLTTRLLLDFMGHFSPITQQARNGQKPDAVCLVVGTCATGFPPNPSGDLIASFTPIVNHCQYFWEAFPARDGRTTYLFTYVDAHPDRLSLTDLFDEYFRLLPDYQGTDLNDLAIERALFGFFPCYQSSPLQPTWDRILALGDSSGAQSPLSFGGFGSMMRHLGRLTTALTDALTGDHLDRTSLAAIQPYQPNLQVTWLFQKTMSVPLGKNIHPQQINQLLADVFTEMDQLGDGVLKPFLQDVVQFGPLALTLWKTSLARPTMPLTILPQVGVGALLAWSLHFITLGLYSLLDRMASFSQAPMPNPVPKPADREQFHRDRTAEAWRYGSGRDYGGLE